MDVDSETQPSDSVNNTSSRTKRPSGREKRHVKKRRISRAIDAEPPPPRSHVTLYDSVAGRVTDSGIRGVGHNRQQYWRDFRNRSVFPINPFDALFRSQDAPQLYEEIDLYGAHRWLSDPPRTTEDPSGQDQGGRGALPDSDMLKAIHEYVSDFYAASTVAKGRFDWRSMDETALLAMGILMEEQIRKSLGEDGWRVFTEPVDDESGVNLQDMEPEVIRKNRGRPPGSKAKKRQDPTESTVEQLHDNDQNGNE